MLKKYIFLFFAFFIVSVFGCATDQDLKRVRQDLKGEILILQKDVEESRESDKSLRKGQADLSADMTDLRDDVRDLRGVVEELGRDVRTGRRDEDIGKKLDEISFRINYMETFLGIAGKKEPRAGSEKEEKGGIPPKDVTEKKTDKEAAYEAAQEAFKERKYDVARKRFQSFLKLFPDTEYSDNAQFWIGECYFFEKGYEKAILEYDKVIKNYPKGDKVSYALLKQGLAFLEIGEKTSARQLLQQVIKDYPNTNQAKIARAKLLEIK